MSFFPKYLTDLSVRVNSDVILFVFVIGYILITLNSTRLCTYVRFFSFFNLYSYLLFFFCYHQSCFFGHRIIKDEIRIY